MEILGYIILFLIINIVIYDKYVQRKKQLLINYPLIGRFRYLFEALREPFRQYFGDEDFYESKDKIDWVYKVAKNHNAYVSFSPNQPLPNPKFLIKHSNIVYNEDEVDDNFSVTFGEDKKYPFTSKSIICRSAMSDGAISPEGTKAFSKGAYLGNFPINTGEGGLTTNFLFTHNNHDKKYMTIVNLSKTDKFIYEIISKLFNHPKAIQLIKSKNIRKGEVDTFIFDREKLKMFRPNWNAPLENFPTEVPEDIPDIIFQLSSGFYSCRDKEGHFDPLKYQKVMRFCRMTEIKVAQGAKQTGGKLTANKVTSSISYFRNVEAGKNAYSPNRLPDVNSVSDLFDFIAKLQELSSKPVGIKIVISSKDGFREIAEEIKRRQENNELGSPDFITIDGGDGGSATAPLFLMDSVGLATKDAIHIADILLKEYGVRDKVKIIASSRILTPDDVVVHLALGADFIGIGRGFMLSASCIRAKMCSGEGSHNCPVGLATQKEKLRYSYLVHKNSNKIKNYHNNLIKGVKTILAIMRKKNVSELTKKDLSYIDKNGFIHEDVDRWLDKKVNG